MNDSILKKVEITKIIEETPAAKTFILKPSHGCNPSYKAGQFITLVFNTAHGEKRRSYSMSSSPLGNEPLSITVKKIDNGEFSRALIYQAKVGDQLVTAGVSGQFTTDRAAPENNFCFIAAGSGITPCFSLIKTLLLQTDKQIMLFYSNVNVATTIFHKQLLDLQKKYSSRFRIHFLFSDHSDLYQRRLSKWLLDQLLERYLGNSISNTNFYICGPFEYMQTVEITLLSHTRREFIFKENFSSLPRQVLPVPPDISEHKVGVQLLGKVYNFNIQYPLSIIKTAKLQGIELPFSCEAGRCGSCIATCTKGEMWMAYNEVLTDKEVRQGRILSCQAYPINGDAEISFDE